jgi:RNA polymerase sporulation-specific sigma factor
MDETMALIESAHAGDKEARDRLVTENMGLVWSIVRRFTGRGHEPEDLFQIGSIGLIKAIDKFDLAYDVKFSTYAVPLIMGEIKRFIRDDGMLKVSRSLKELAARAGGVREELSARLGREPTVEEMAVHMGICTEELAAALDSGAEVESLQKTIYHGDGNEICLMDKLEEERNGQEDAVNRMVLEELLQGLEPQARQIIVMRYYQERTQTQIAGILGISQVQVSRLEKKILKSMRDKLHGK